MGIKQRIVTSAASLVVIGTLMAGTAFAGSNNVYSNGNNNRVYRSSYNSMYNDHDYDNYTYMSNCGYNSWSPWQRNNQNWQVMQYRSCYNNFYQMNFQRYNLRNSYNNIYWMNYMKNYWNMQNHTNCNW